MDNEVYSLQGDDAIFLSRQAPARITTSTVQYIALCKAAPVVEY